MSESSDAPKPSLRPSLKKRDNAPASAPAAAGEDLSPDGSPAPAAADTPAGSPAGTPTAAGNTVSKEPDTREFYLHIEEEILGPYPFADVVEYIADGRVEPNTPCVPEGSEDWGVASDFFTFTAEAIAEAAAAEAAGDSEDGASKDKPDPAIAPRINRRFESINSVDERESNERPELNPLLRKRLIQLGLATAVNIDTYTEASALETLAIYELAMNKDKRGKKLAATGSFFGAAIIVFLLYLIGPAAWLGEAIAGIFIGNSEDYFKRQGTIVEQRREIDTALDKLDFKANPKNAPEKPKGKRDAKDVVIRPALVIPPNKQYVLQFGVNFDKFPITDAGETASGTLVCRKPVVAYFKTQLSSEQQKRAAELAESVWKYLNPNRLKWALEPADIAASWKLFREKNASNFSELISSAVTKLDGAALPADARDGKKKLIIDGQQSRNLVAFLTVGLASGDGSDITLAFPAEPSENFQHTVVFTGASSRATTDADAREFVNFVVTEKQKAGEQPFGIAVNFQRRQHFIERRTEPLHYVGFICEGGLYKQPLWFAVSKEEFEKFQIGDKLLAKELLKYDNYQKPLGPQLSETAKRAQIKWKPAPPQPPKPKAAPAPAGKPLLTPADITGKKSTDTISDKPATTDKPANEEKPATEKAAGEKPAQ